MFQSLNGTGVGLTQADLLRNYIFMLLPSRGETVYEQLLRPMEQLVGSVETPSVSEPKDKLDATATVAVSGPEDDAERWRQIDWRRAISASRQRQPHNNDNDCRSRLATR